MDKVQGPATVKMMNIVSGLRAQGIDIISFSMGEPDFATPRHIQEAAAAAILSGFTHYTPSAGIPELLEAIVEKSKNENHIQCTTKDVVVTPAKLAIFEAIVSMIGDGDEVIIPDPAWVSYEPITRFAGGVPVLARTTDEDEFRLKPETVEKLITKNTRMIVVNSPSNPTGAVMTRDDMKGIADIAKAHDLVVLSDELYEKILYDGAEHVSIASLPGMMERTITVNGFSKGYAMTGWRIGWFIAPPDIMKEMKKVQEHTITCATSFVQKGAVAALKGPQEPVRAMVQRFNARRDMIVDGLNKIPGFECIRPHGAFYVFPKFGFKMSSSEFAEFLLKEAHVAVTPGSAFGPAGEGHLRISYATSRENIAKGLENIEKAVAKLK